MSSEAQKVSNLETMAAGTPSMTPRETIYSDVTVTSGDLIHIIIIYV